jgi:hypothetical protein
MTIRRQHFIFGALCVQALAGMVIFGLIYLSHETFAVSCCVVGLLAAAVIFFWSLLSFRRYRLRAVVGLIVGLIVFWLLLIIPGYVEAKRRALTTRPNQATEQTWPSHFGCNPTLALRFSR